MCWRKNRPSPYALAVIFLLIATAGAEAAADRTVTTIANTTDNRVPVTAQIEGFDTDLVDTVEFQIKAVSPGVQFVTDTKSSDTTEIHVRSVNPAATFFTDTKTLRHDHSTYSDSITALTDTHEHHSTYADSVTALTDTHEFHSTVADSVSAFTDTKEFHSTFADSFYGRTERADSKPGDSSHVQITEVSPGVSIIVDTKAGDTSGISQIDTGSLGRRWNLNQREDTAAVSSVDTGRMTVGGTVGTFRTDTVPGDSSGISQIDTASLGRRWGLNPRDDTGAISSVDTGKMGVWINGKVYVERNDTQEFQSTFSDSSTTRQQNPGSDTIFTVTIAAAASTSYTIGQIAEWMTLHPDVDCWIRFNAPAERVSGSGSFPAKAGAYLPLNMRRAATDTINVIKNAVAGSSGTLGVICGVY